MRLVRLLIVSAVATALLGLGSVAQAASPKITFVAPSPTDGATLTTDAVSFAFTYAKKPTATRSVSCSLAGPTPSSESCDAPVPSGSGAKSGKSYTGLANGSYTLTVSLALTDGGRATVTRNFTINVPPPAADISITGEAVYRDPNGTVVTVTNAGPDAAHVEVIVQCQVGVWATLSGAALNGWTITSLSDDLSRYQLGKDFASGSSSQFYAACTVYFPPGLYPGYVEVYSSSVTDPDSSPNNAVSTEDDYLSIPVVE